MRYSRGGEDTAPPPSGRRINVLEANDGPLTPVTDKRQSGQIPRWRVERRGRIRL